MIKLQNNAEQECISETNCVWEKYFKYNYMYFLHAAQNFKFVDKKWLWMYTSQEIF